MGFALIDRLLHGGSFALLIAYGAQGEESVADWEGDESVLDDEPGESGAEAGPADGDEQYAPETGRRRVALDD